MMRLPSLALILTVCGGNAAGADEYRVYVDNARPSRELIARMGRLQSDPAHAGVAWRIVRLGAGVPDATLRANTIAALRDGIYYLPTLVLSDEKGPYARVVGAVATQEGRTFDERLAQARSMKTSDRRPAIGVRAADRASAELYELLVRVSQIDDDTGSETVLQLEDDVRRYLQTPQVTAAERQRLTLEVLYPLALRRYAKAYRGAHTPESEALFLRAVAILEEARDIDPASEAGKRAHEWREELRRARLRAARYD